MDEPLSDFKREYLHEQPLTPDERVVLTIVADQSASRGERAFKYQIHELIEATGVPKASREKIIRRLVDLGAISGGWHNVGAVSEPDLVAIYQVTSQEAVDILLRDDTIRPGIRQRPSSLAERASIVCTA